MTITDPSTGTEYELNARSRKSSVVIASFRCRYIFPVRSWIALDDDGKAFECTDKKEDIVNQQRHRQPTKYKIVVHTGDVKKAGTDANVSIILYGTLGDTGVRPLKQKGRNLFEHGQADEFVIECLDLGK